MPAATGTQIAIGSDSPSSALNGLAHVLVWFAWGRKGGPSTEESSTNSIV